MSSAHSGEGEQESEDESRYEVEEESHEDLEEAMNNHAAAQDAAAQNAAVGRTGGADDDSSSDGESNNDHGSSVGSSVMDESDSDGLEVATAVPRQQIPPALTLSAATTAEPRGIPPALATIRQRYENLREAYVDLFLLGQDQRQELASVKRERDKLLILVQRLMEDDTADRQLRDHRRTIKALKKEIDTLKAKPEPTEPWRLLLREYLNGSGSYSYREIYEKSCKQENMSLTLRIFHPDFHLQEKNLEDAVPDEDANEDANEEGLHQDIPRGPRVEEYISEKPPSKSVGEPLHRHPPLVELRPFVFEQLPAEVQAKIFGMVFVKRSLVHCLSRLDPFVAPGDFPDADEPHRSQLPSRFHFGTSPCRVRQARRPNDFLAPLLVCKRWLFIGTHAFYGANTFAFSSLGEWHRFCNGVGAARVERMANVELMWHGSLMPAQNPQLSLRSTGLMWFMKTRRLRTLVVHIDESSLWRRRRGNETHSKKCKFHDTLNGQDCNCLGQPAWNRRRNGELFVDDGIEEDTDAEQLDEAEEEKLSPTQLLIRRTLRQPNCRKFRSMRTVQGMDYVYQLRGMKWVRFKDRNAGERRQSIRDWSFLKDVNSVVTLEKQPHHALKSELENLSPLTGLTDWIPTPEDIRLIKMFYDETPTSVSVAGSDDSDDDTDDDNVSPRRSGGPANGAPRTVIEIDSDSDSHADFSDSDSDGPPSPGETPNTTISQTQKNAENSRMEADRMSSASSDLFLSERSGPAGGSPGAPQMPVDDHPEPMEVDHNGPEDGFAGGRASTESGLFVPSGSGTAPPQDPDGTDLTGVDDDDDDGRFPAHAQSPPDSEDETDFEYDLDNNMEVDAADSIEDNATTDVESSRSSSKRQGGDDASTSSEDRSSKRARVQ